MWKEITYILIVFFAILLLVSLYEKQYPMALYWLSSVMITVSVLLMNGG